MLVRRETSADVGSIARVHRSAFADIAAAEGLPEPIEPALVDELRANESWIPELSFVAESDGEVAGHVCLTRASVSGGARGGPIVQLGPIGVDAPLWRRGVGSALMHAALGAADAMDFGAVVLVGHRDYYPRFGFVPGDDVGLKPDVADWAPAFQVRPLTRFAPANATVRAPEPFYRF
ncbi:N-acetyltransferase [Rhodococcus rhodnii]|uniref:N-acetyltransferase n=1 Tax=Rhodococcus rhodnii TaxID=38312 RepID=A0A6P2CNX2_9NOCA|nr:N-acetyltransferase [Rhodococcus rhodnii]TXG92836.1 N-acetyltransferase [Rhodococcus rhodnii]